MPYSRDLIILLTEYLKSERRSLKLLKITKTDLKHYTSKIFFSPRQIELVKSKANKFIINSPKDFKNVLKVIKKSKIKGLILKNNYIPENIKNLEILVIEKSSQTNFWQNRDLNLFGLTRDVKSSQIGYLPIQEPNPLRCLTLDEELTLVFKNDFPRNLKKLKILKIMCYQNVSGNPYMINDVVFPKKIEKLVLTGHINFNLSYLKNLKYLYLNPKNYKTVLTSKFPKKLKYLHLGRCTLFALNLIQQKIKVLICYEGHLCVDYDLVFKKLIYPDKILVTPIRNKTAEAIRKKYNIPNTTEIVIDTNTDQDKYLRINEF